MFFGYVKRYGKLTFWQIYRRKVKSINFELNRRRSKAVPSKVAIAENFQKQFCAYPKAVFIIKCQLTY